MKKILALLLALVLVFSFAACNSTSEETTNEENTENTEGTTGGFTVAYVCKDLSQEWFIVESAKIEEYCKANGATEYITVDSEMNEEKYLDGVQNMIEQKVDMLIVCPPDQNLSQKTVELCDAAGIPVIAVDDPLVDGDTLLAPAIQLSAYSVGESMGEWLANYMTTTFEDLEAIKGESAVLCLAADTVSSVVPRTDGQIDSFVAALPDWEEKVIRADYDTTTDGGYEVMAAQIAANPTVKYWFVMAVNDEGALGAVRAIEAAGIDADACVVGCGAYHFDDEIYTNPETCFKAASYFSSNEAGEMVATEAMNYLNNGTTMCGDSIEDGQTFGRKYFAGQVVDVTNYVEVMGDDCSVGE